MNVQQKYQPVTLPETPAELDALAIEREIWAKEARDRDQLGSAREFELTALALRALSKTR